MDSEILKSFCQVFFALARSEKKAEIIREMLCQFESFEPYTVFKKLSSENSSCLCVNDIKLFMERNRIFREENDITSNFLRHYDRDHDGFLSYSEFLSVVLPSDQPILRAIVAQREPYCTDILDEEIEYTLARLIDAEISSFESIKQNKLPQNLDFVIPTLFQYIDNESTGFLDFENLLEFFKSLEFFPYEEEVIFMLRRLDSDDDGRLELSDLMRPFLENANVDEEILKFDQIQKNLAKSFPSANFERQEEVTKHFMGNFTNNCDRFEEQPQIKKKNLAETFPRNLEIKNYGQQSETTVTKSKMTTVGTMGGAFLKRDSLDKPNRYTGRSKSQKQKFTYYPYEPIRKCCSPIRSDTANRASTFRSTYSKSPIQRPLFEETVKTERLLGEKPLESGRATLRSLRAKYSGNQEENQRVYEKSRENLEEMNNDKPSRERKFRYNGKTYAENHQSIQEKSEKPCIFNEKQQVTTEKRYGDNDENPKFYSQGAFFRSNNYSEKYSFKNIQNDDIGTQIAPNTSKELRDFFNFVINCETKLENLKKELSHRPDFNLVDLFMFFDREKKGFCELSDFQSVMEHLRVKAKEKDLRRLFKRFDRNRKGFLRFAEFCDCFCPADREGFERLNQRKPINSEEKFRMKELFSHETLRITANVLVSHIQNEKEQEKIRKLIFKSENCDFSQIFRRLDGQKEGFLGKKHLVEFMESQGVFVDEEGIDLLIERFDLDKDKRISLNEFVMCLQD